jgi:selenide,water dikinase
LLAGTGGFEDAGIYRLDDERALVVTIDFFPPIVDDARWFGRIAAANALSDVYAMGGEVLTALNIVGWPAELPYSLLGEVLAGGLEKIRESGGVLAGGHSVRDNEVKYGLAVTGIVHPDRFWRNGGARPGDVLLLTKPLGMGTVSTAIKKSFVAEESPLVLAAMEQMATLNRGAARAMRGIEVHAATDVTGFGLAGHGREMADAAGLTLEIDVRAVPLFPGALDLARKGAVSGGGKRARASLMAKIDVGTSIDAAIVDMLFDAETSGGLLLAIPPAAVDAALAALTREATPVAAVIGRFVAREECSVRFGD